MEIPLHVLNKNNVMGFFTKSEHIGKIPKGELKIPY